MSVAPDWKALPGIKIPMRLKSALPGDKKARGSNRLYCWQMGEGAFVRAPVSGGLQLAPDRANDGVVDHGVVEPDSSMPVENFQRALAATREEWKLIPEESPA